MSRRRCVEPRADGRPCGAAPLREGQRCLFHDPAHAAAVAEGRRLAGIRRRREGTIQAAFDIEDLRTVEGLWRLLEIVTVDTLHLDNGLGRNRTLLAAIASGTKLVTADEIQRRLLALEEALRSRPVDTRLGVRSILDEDTDADE